MRASELIKKLHAIIVKYGDLPVKTTEWGSGCNEITSLQAYSEDGEIPDKLRKDRQPAVIVLY